MRPSPQKNSSQKGSSSSSQRASGSRESPIKKADPREKKSESGKKKRSEIDRSSIISVERNERGDRSSIESSERAQPRGSIVVGTGGNVRCNVKGPVQNRSSPGGTGRSYASDQNDSRLDPTSTIGLDRTTVDLTNLSSLGSCSTGYYTDRMNSSIANNVGDRTIPTQRQGSNNVRIAPEEHNRTIDIVHGNERGTTRDTSQQSSPNERSNQKRSSLRQNLNLNGNGSDSLVNYLVQEFMELPGEKNSVLPDDDLVVPDTTISSDKISLLQRSLESKDEKLHLFGKLHKSEDKSKREVKSLIRDLYSLIIEEKQLLKTKEKLTYDLSSMEGKINEAISKKMQGQPTV